MRNTGSALWIAGVLVMSGLGLAGCATKKFVNEQVAPVTDRLQSQEAKLGTLERSVQDAMARAEAAGKLAEGKFVYSMVLNDDGVRFATGRSELSSESETRLLELAERLKSENRNVFIEIQGHTDSTGSKAFNDQLGQARAESVRRYLNLQGVALNRLAVISYGPDAPAATNDTPEGRAANRRVVVIVMQ